MRKSLRHIEKLSAKHCARGGKYKAGDDIVSPHAINLSAEKRHGDAKGKADYDHNGIGGNGLAKKFYHRVHIIITSLPPLHPAGAAVSGKILFARERAVSG